MPLPRFAYVAAHSLSEASSLLAEHGEGARLMAGGTDLLIQLRRKVRVPSVVIGLSGIPGADRLAVDEVHGLIIGPLAVLATVADDADVRRRFRALAQAAAATATVPVRNRATVAGNLCNASPAADTAAPLLVYDAEVVLLSGGGQRTLPLAQFFRGPGRTSLERAEVLAEIRVPAPGPSTGSDYQRLSGRSHVDIAAVSVAALVALDARGVVTRARVALGAVAPVPLRVERAEELLVGHPVAPERMAQAAAAAAAAARPISDVRASADYRRRMVEVLTRRALTRAAEAAGWTHA